MLRSHGGALSGEELGLALLTTCAYVWYGVGEGKAGLAWGVTGCPLGAVWCLAVGAGLLGAAGCPLGGIGPLIIGLGGELICLLLLWDVLGLRLSATSFSVFAKVGTTALRMCTWSYRLCRSKVGWGAT